LGRVSWGWLLMGGTSIACMGRLVGSWLVRLLLLSEVVGWKVAAWWGWLDQTHCWVLRKRADLSGLVCSPCLGGWAGLGGEGLVSLWSDHVPAARLCVVGGVDAVRSLRTVQWTRASLVFVVQVFKSNRWMPWHQEPKKD